MVFDAEKTLTVTFSSEEIPWPILMGEAEGNFIFFGRAKAL
jgi:hypothetical protein